MDKNRIWIIACIFLIVIIIGVIVKGSKNTYGISLSVEGFKTQTAKKVTPTASSDNNDDESYEEVSKTNFSSKESKIFEAIKNKKLSDKAINDMVSEGIITEKLIEKFLAHLDTMPDQEPMTVKELFSDKPQKTMKKENENDNAADNVSGLNIEPFVGGPSGKYAFL